MTRTIRAPHRYTMGLPGTFEVHDKDGYWYGTSTDFKTAEARADQLNADDPDGEYDWTRIK